MKADSSEDYSHFISCLNEASQNFRPAIKAVGQQVEIIIVLINELTKTCERELKTSISPSQKNEVSHRLHCALQAAIFCVKNYINDSTTHSTTVKKHFKSLSVNCDQLIDNEDLPMDVKNNCAMLIVLHSVLTEENDHIKWIRDEKSSVDKKLCLIFGVISTLNSENIDFKLFVDITNILKDVFIKSPTDPARLQSVCRSFMQITKKISNIKISESESSTYLHSIFKTTLSVAFINLDHHMDSTRFMMKETIKNLAATSLKIIDDDSLTNRIFHEINQLPNVNLKSVAVLTISTIISGYQILHRLPSFHKFLLRAVSENISYNHNLINCYEALANSTHRETKFETWFLDFVDEVLNFMKSQSHPEVRLILENLVIRFIKTDTRILDKILQQKSLDTGFVLLCLSTGKKMGIFEKEPSSDNLWKGIISFSNLQTAMISEDDNVRASALKLIIETRKTVEGFTQQEMDSIVFFLKYNINVQSPSSRQNILELLKNMFVRLQSVLLSLNKRKDQVSLGFYFKFLIHLQSICLENLFEGANFSRRALSLRILLYIVEIVKVHFKEESSVIWTKPKIGVLLNVVNDSFEANKEMVVEILRILPQDVLKAHICIDLVLIEKMMKSIRPPESLTSTYLMEILTLTTLNNEDFKFRSEANSESSQDILCVFIWCEKHILEGLVLAEKSLIVAASSYPLYGFVFCIRHLLLKIDLKSLEITKSVQWQDFFARLIILCKRLTEIVSPVVNSDCPEGIIPPEEVQVLDENTRKKWKEISEKTTPQIILLYSWRTIKEVSLLLGNICLKAPLVEDHVGVVSVGQLLNIGDHFLDLLSKIKHRGAFEQSFFGFSQFCLRLWQCNEPQLHKLPTEMLQQMILSISGVENEKTELLSLENLCATRRSAGLPFIIQALITSELKVSSSKNFQFVMKSLIQFSRHGKYLETRTHSMNILRALFRSTDLNEAIGEYIADGIECAILGYGADSWLERNSSTLLLSSLMIRIFGVQRTKDGNELSIRNKMSGRLFFLRYPGLYDFFMQQLLEAAEYVSSSQMNARLHPLLLILIRLFPSSTEGSESKLDLVGFIPVVSRCTGCTEMQTRILCAKFIAGVLSPLQLVPRIRLSVRALIDNCNCHSNMSHGLLLQILFMVKALPKKQQHEKEILTILKDIDSVGKMFKSLPVIYGTFLDIILEISERLWLNEEYKEEIYHCLDNSSFIDGSKTFGTSFVSKKNPVLKLMKFILNENSQVLDQIDSTKMCDLNDVLNTFLMISDFEYALSMKEEYEIDPKEIFYFKSFPKQRRDQLSQEFRHDKNKKRVVASLTKSPDYRVKTKAFDILSLMSYDKGDMELKKIQDLINMAMSKPEQLKKSILNYANICVKEENLFSQLDFKFLVVLSTDSSFQVK